MNGGFWIVLGLFFMLAELVIPGFVIFFFGVGAVITGLARWLMPTIAISWQLLLFVVFSAGTFLAARRLFPNVFWGKTQITELPEEQYENTGELATVTEQIAPESPGRVSFQGSIWKAEASEAISVGTQVHIVCRRNIILVVKKV